MGYIRTKTRPQNDRPVIRKQDNFGQGLNVDIPASDFDNNANQNLENYVAFERFLEGRSGSVFIKDLPGSGTVHSIDTHPTENVCILHRGDQIWQVGAVDTEIKSFVWDGFVGTPPSFAVDKPSQLKPFGNNFLLYTEDGIFQILIEYTNKSFFQMNSGQPLDTDDFVVPDGNFPFKYYTTYTFSIIIDEATGLAAPNITDRFSDGYKVIWESPPVIAGTATLPNISYYNLRPATGPLGQGAGFASMGVSMGALDVAAGIEAKITHIAVYITPDLGENGFNNLNFEQFAFGGETHIDHTSLPQGVGVNVSQRIIIDRLAQANTRLRSVGFKALPSGDVGGITDGFVFSALDGARKVYYSQRIPDDTVAGFYNPAVQFHEFDDGISILAPSPDNLTIITKKKTAVCTLTQFENVGVFESLFVLTHWKVNDETIGVEDSGSFIEIEDGSYMAICSDSSVRAWDGSSWSRDVAENRVRNIIERIQAGSTLSAYYRGAYFIWFKVDDNAVNNDLCMRFSVKRESGKGWTFYTGDDWVFPSDGAGGFVGPNFLDTTQTKDDFLFVVNKEDSKIYWIETFYSTENLSINSLPITKYWNDKVTGITPETDGTAIICKVRSRDETGERESFNLIHSESHAYLSDIINPITGTAISSPPESGIDYPDLLVDALAFVDGVQVPNQTAGMVQSDGDIQFWGRVSGSRIAIEYRTNRSGHQLRGTDSRFHVQDILRPNRGPATTVAADFQGEFLNGLKVWNFSRPKAFIDRITQQSIPNAFTDTVVGPDGRNDAIKVGENLMPIERFRRVDRTVYTDEFTISFWIADAQFVVGLNTVLMQFQDSSGTPNFTLVAQNATTLSILEGTGTVTIDSIVDGLGPVNGFSNIILVRTIGDDVRVYQNAIFKGTLVFEGSFGGGFFQAGGEP